MKQQEKDYRGLYLNGFAALAVFVILIAVGAWLIYKDPDNHPTALTGAAMIAIAVLCCLKGYFMLEPNEARVFTLFGKYVGTFRHTGFFWVNPFLSHKKVSLRARNLNVDPIKVNDREGNPILIGMVLVWHLNNTYKALFEIDSQALGSTASATMAAFERFVSVQSDAALRQVAGMYAYDSAQSGSHNEITLRGEGDTVSEVLLQKLNERLEMAGLEVLEARINYLAYAPEIAAVMLRRQQANAIIAAREKIVDGAVSMVKLALDKLENDDIVRLDSDHKASLVSNLLVVLCADEPAQPIINSGN